MSDRKKNKGPILGTKVDNEEVLKILGDPAGWDEQTSRVREQYYRKPTKVAPLVSLPNRNSPPRAKAASTDTDDGQEETQEPEKGSDEQK
jgi:hypothetical protein